MLTAARLVLLALGFGVLYLAVLGALVLWRYATCS